MSPCELVVVRGVSKGILQFGHRLDIPCCWKLKQLLDVTASVCCRERDFVGVGSSSSQLSVGIWRCESHMTSCDVGCQSSSTRRFSDPSSSCSLDGACASISRYSLSGRSSSACGKEFKSDDTSWSSFSNMLSAEPMHAPKPQRTKHLVTVSEAMSFMEELIQQQASSTVISFMTVSRVAPCVSRACRVCRRTRFRYCVFMYINIR